MIDGAILCVKEFKRLPDDTTNVFITAISERELTITRRTREDLAAPDRRGKRDRGHDRRGREGESAV